MKLNLKTGPAFRALNEFGIEIEDSERRVVKFSGSSEYPVERFDWDTGERYMEILDHSPENIDLSRVLSGGPILDCHWGDQIGVVESITLENKRTVVTARFSSAGDRANQIWADVANGIRRNVSVGYRLTKILEVKSGDNSDTSGRSLKQIRFAWQPYEFSMVTVPADPTVGVGRSNLRGVETLTFDVPPEMTTTFFILN